MTDTGVDVFGELSITLGKLEATIRRADERERRRASIPADQRMANSGVYPSSGSLVLDMGGPDLGRVWLLRRLSVGGATPTTTAAGRADIFVGSRPATTPLSDWIDAAATLPLTAYWSGREVAIRPGERLWVVVSSGTVAQVYVATGAVEAYEEAAFTEAFGL